MHMKETADLILQKEQGIAEMVGDYAKLQAQFRNEVEQKPGYAQGQRQDCRGL